jgi:hypothetical protein
MNSRHDWQHVMWCVSGIATAPVLSTSNVAPGATSSVEIEIMATSASIKTQTTAPTENTYYVGALRLQRRHQSNSAYCRKFRDSMTPKLRRLTSSDELRFIEMMADVGTCRSSIGLARSSVCVLPRRQLLTCG